jgi:hypothetical protein
VDAAHGAALDAALFGDPGALLTLNGGRAATPPSAASGEVHDDPAPPKNGDPAASGGKRYAPLAEAGAGASTTSDDASEPDGADPFAVE